MTDLHIHTCISHDSKESAENYILAAKSKGVTCLGFSEHYDYDVFLEGEGEKAPLANLEDYEKQLSELSQRYPDVKILKGIELGYVKEALPHYQKLLEDGKFDYSILSVHTLKGRGDCYFPEFYKGLTRKQAYEKYFQAVLDSVRCNINYQIIGHIGYVERYAPFPDKHIIYSEFCTVLDEILKEIIARDKCLEINTSAKGTGEISIPNTEILDRYIELGGRNFSLGSDAHSAERFMENFPLLKEFLLSRGITQTCRFEKGKTFKENL